MLTIILSLFSRGAGEPEQTVDGPFAELDEPLRRAITVRRTYRREWCESAGVGFELGELGYKSGVPIRPSLVA